MRCPCPIFTPKAHPPRPVLCKNVLKIEYLCASVLHYGLVLSYMSCLWMSFKLSPHLICPMYNMDSALLWVSPKRITYMVTLFCPPTLSLSSLMSFTWISYCYANCWGREGGANVITLKVHIHDIFIARFQTFFCIFQWLINTKHSTTNIFKNLLQINPDILNFWSIPVSQSSRAEHCCRRCGVKFGMSS
jgi:hypothetical protein